MLHQPTTEHQAHPASSPQPRNQSPTPLSCVAADMLQRRTRRCPEQPNAPQAGAEGDPSRSRGSRRSRPRRAGTSCRARAAPQGPASRGHAPVSPTAALVTPRPLPPRSPAALRNVRRHPSPPSPSGPAALSHCAGASTAPFSRSPLGLVVSATFHRTQLEGTFKTPLCSRQCHCDPLTQITQRHIQTCLKHLQGGLTSPPPWATYSNA